MQCGCLAGETALGAGDTDGSCSYTAVGGYCSKDADCPSDNLPPGYNGTGPFYDFGGCQLKCATGADCAGIAPNARCWIENPGTAEPGKCAFNNAGAPPPPSPINAHAYGDPCSGQDPAWCYDDCAGPPDMQCQCRPGEDAAGAGSPGAHCLTIGCDHTSQCPTDVPLGYAGAGPVCLGASIGPLAGSCSSNADCSAMTPNAYRRPGLAFGFPACAYNDRQGSTGNQHFTTAAEEWRRPHRTRSDLNPGGPGPDPPVSSEAGAVPGTWGWWEERLGLSGLKRLRLVSWALSTLSTTPCSGTPCPW
jgi:hypothetical protein